MAKRKRTETLVKARFNLEAKQETPFYYVNYMAVAHNAFDFTLSVVRIPAGFSPDQIETAKKGEPIILEPTLQLVFPPAVAEGLVRALQTQLQKYGTENDRKENANAE